MYKAKSRGNKFKAVKTEFKGKLYDSKFEASVAMELDLEKRAGNILDFDTQYRVDMYAYSKCGNYTMKKSHKVDFRVHNLDGTFTLLEAKGFETQDYKDRRKWLETFWLPEHPDHDYEVVYQKKRTWKPKKCLSKI